MKNLEEFYDSFISEMAGVKGMKRRTKEEMEAAKNAVPASEVDKKSVKKAAKGAPKPGKINNDNAYGKWAVDRPEADWAEKFANYIWKNESKNMKQLAVRFKTKHDFLVLGEAGWAKSTLIRKVAKMHGYHVITVYLDKAQATDLGGIPIPSKDDKTGKYEINVAIPGWVTEMVEHPENNYLLFFDEMNQAMPDVLNALMPIILEHEVMGIRFENFFVGAAGNLKEENEQGLSEIQGPLASRLRPIYKWKSGRDPQHGEAEWQSSFDYLRKTYPNVPKKVMDKLYECRDYWASPRDIERTVLQMLVRDEMKNDFADLVDVDDVKDWLYDISYKDYRKETQGSKANDSNYLDAMDDAAEFIYNYMAGLDTGDDDREDSAEVDSEWVEIFKDSLITGQVHTPKGSVLFIDDDGNEVISKGETFVCTKENIITALYPPEVTHINATELERICQEIEDSGKEVKFPTNKSAEADVKANGWIWPKYAVTNAKDDILKEIRRTKRAAASEETPRTRKHYVEK